MSLYSIAVFLHVVGALGLFAGVGLEQTGLRGLRGASTGAQVREGVLVLRRLRRIEEPTGLVILATGCYMLAVRWGGQPWAGLSLLGMVAMAALGMRLNGRRVAAIARGISAVDGTIPSALQQRLHDPVLLKTANVRAALGLWIVFNMTVKPGIPLLFAGLGIALVIGWVAGWSSGHHSVPEGRHAIES